LVRIPRSDVCEVPSLHPSDIANQDAQFALSPEVKPPEDGAASLKRDAAIAAFDYVKPGRHKPDRRR